MVGDLFINGVDADTLGIKMGDGFIGALLAPSPQKSGIENNSRNENGKRLIPNTKIDERTVTLVFNVEGDTKQEFLSNLKNLYTIFSKGVCLIKVPALGNEVYKLYFQKTTQFAENTELTFCKVAAVFNEPNPADRG